MEVMVREKFNFFLPIELEKAGKDGDRMVIKGIASTPHKDSQEEILEPSGFDLKRFLSQGFLNWNHLAKSDPSYIVGEPTVAKITKGGELYIEGELYSDSPLAKKVWDLAKTLEKAGSKRRLGFSIEGTATERDFVNPKIVRKAEITGCAITPTPVNINTVMEIVKGETDTLYQDYQFDLMKAEDVECILEGVDEERGVRYVVDRDLNIIEKSMDSAAVDPLTLEDLEGHRAKLVKAVEVLSEAYRRGVLSEEQQGEFKKALDRIKDMNILTKI